MKEGGRAKGEGKDRPTGEARVGQRDEGGRGGKNRKGVSLFLSRFLSLALGIPTSRLMRTERPTSHRPPSQSGRWGRDGRSKGKETYDGGDDGDRQGRDIPQGVGQVVLGVFLESGSVGS